MRRSFHAGWLQRQLKKLKAEFHSGPYYEQPAIHGQPERGSFRLPRNVFAALGRGDLKLGGAVVHAMFGIEDDPDDPTIIHPDAVRIIGSGNLNAGRRVLERFVQQLRRQPQDDFGQDHPLVE